MVGVVRVEHSVGADKCHCEGRTRLFQRRRRQRSGSGRSSRGEGGSSRGPGSERRPDRRQQNAAFPNTLTFHVATVALNHINKIVHC